MQLLVEFSALGMEPVPWSVPTFGSGVNKKGKRYTFKRRNKKSRLHSGVGTLAQWQQYVADAAKDAMLELGASLHLGPIALSVVFVVPTPAGWRNGEIAFCGLKHNEEKDEYTKIGSLADLTNMIKGIEDALEDIVFANDVQTRAYRECAVLFGSMPGAHVRVYGIDGSDFPGVGDPVSSLPDMSKCVKRRSKKSGPSPTPSDTPSPSRKPRRRKPQQKSASDQSGHGS